jgi:hypothetical protein
MPTLIGLSDTSNGYPRGNTGFFFKRFLTTIVEEGLAILKGLFLQAFFSPFQFTTGVPKNIGLSKSPCPSMFRKVIHLTYALFFGFKPKNRFDD